MDVQGALDEAKALFHDEKRTEFIVVSIPTMMAMAESERLAKSLEEQSVPCRRIVINQLVRSDTRRTIWEFSSLHQAARCAKLCKSFVNSTHLATQTKTGLRNTHRYPVNAVSHPIVHCRWTTMQQKSSCSRGELTSNELLNACAAIHSSSACKSLKHPCWTSR